MKLHHLLELICFVILDTFVSQIVLGNENNIAKFSKMNCLSIDAEYLVNVSCRVKAVQRDLYQINGQGTFIKPADNIMVRMRLFKKANTYKPFLVDVTENLCNFLSKKHNGVYLKIIGEIYLPYSNINSSCPLIGLQIIKDMPLNANTLPSIWPNGEFRLDFTLYRNGNILITMRFDFEVQEKLRSF